MLLGGWRKSAKTGYVTNYIQYYSPELNIIQVGKGLLPTGIFRQLSINYQSGVYNICCETKRDSTSFGPNLPHILTVDLIKNRFQINNFM